MKSTIAGAAASCFAGLVLALVATASTAHADPPTPGAPPSPVVVGPVPSAPTVQAAGTDVAPLPGVAGPAPAGTDAALPPEGIPHLASPTALPPGSTMDPQDNDSPNVSYLKDLWQAVQNHEISGKEALVMGLAQRGMNTPYPNQAPGPNVPIGPADQGVAPPPVGPLPTAPTGPVPPVPTP